MPIERAAGRRRPGRRLILAWLAGGAICVAPPAFAADGIYGYTDRDGVTNLSNVSSDGPYRLVLRNPEAYRLKPRPEHRLASAAIAAPEPEAANHLYAEEVGEAAKTFGLSPALLHAVIRVESNYNPAAISPKGAVGLMQLMPGTSERFGVSNPLRPQDNIRGGARYLRLLLEMFDQDLKLALAAYNAGEQTVIRYGRRVPPYPETLEYVERVMRHYGRQAHDVAPPVNARAYRRGSS